MNPTQLPLERALLFLLILALLAMPTLAHADPFQQSGYQVKTWLVSTLGPWAAVAVIGAGLMALGGILSGMLALRILLGIGFIFGADQIVSMFRSWAGV
jgi:type IV secretory pathway VirB2 component (pilin)